MRESQGTFVVECLVLVHSFLFVHVADVSFGVLEVYLLEVYRQVPPGHQLFWLRLVASPSIPVNAGPLTSLMTESR